MTRDMHPKRLSLTRTQLALVTVVAALVGGFVATYLPFGTVPLRVAEGQAWLMADGRVGSFQADNGVTTAFSADLVWTNANGQTTAGVRPSCLWETQAHAPLSRGAKVEAGYRWVKTPDGVSSPIVAWLKCL
ncbi:hypothetical protein Mth01_18100 [Sphaerimonospora thailandensis]|uniref:Uncharacterized protein n=1 Tax=Sphaerimonospora thailandensis TaxID=795644 RepID=A0A8J3VYL0_9ACTN|nr:hypothetical protein Mth01_18100 [Sphaerimonospora thailandensis]